MGQYHFFLYILAYLVLGWSSVLIAQTGVTGHAIVSLVDTGEACGGMGRLVEIHVDISGLRGTDDELAGLNSFVLSFTLDTPDVFASAISGNTPSMGWSLITTRRSLITTHLTLVSWVADTLAPNQSYHVATILFSGIQGSTNMSLDLAASSLGSRVVSGDGPGPIPIDSAAVVFVIDIPATFNMDIHTGASLWLQEDSEYALINGPHGPINIQDLVQLVSCGAE